MGSLASRGLRSDEVTAFIEMQLQIAFRAGFMTAADMVTMSGHEELAGKLRRTADEARADNDNLY